MIGTAIFILLAIAFLAAIGVLVVSFITPSSDYTSDLDPAPQINSASPFATAAPSHLLTSDQLEQFRSQLLQSYNDSELVFRNQRIAQKSNLALTLSILDSHTLPSVVQSFGNLEDEIQMEESR